MKRNQSNTNAMLYYLENILKNNDEKVDNQFIDNILIKNKIDVNYCDETNENALFKVNNQDKNFLQILITYFKAIRAEDQELVMYLISKGIAM